MSASPATTLPVKRSLPPLPNRPLSPRLLEMRARATSVAARLRELDWKTEVGMTELSGWEYGTRANEMAQTLGGDELRALGRLAAAGGVLPEGTDLVSLGAGFLAVSASATYSPLDKQILLVDKTNDDSLLTHEFVHALQDQHFDLMKLLVVRPYSFDRTEAVFAVIEGDAMNVQRRAEEGDAYGRRSLEDIARQERERFDWYRMEAGKLFPPLLIETFIFRYRDGARFVEAVRRRGGESAVDDLFQRPPASSEQILHPEKYLQREAPRDVRVDEAGFTGQGWRITASTPIGEIGMRGLLMAGVSEQEAHRAAAGWGGDSAYLFEREQEGAPLFVWKTVWDSREDAAEFFRAYNNLQRRRGDTKPDKTTSLNEMVWREGGRVTLVRLEGESLIIMRGTEKDINGALNLAGL